MSKKRKKKTRYFSDNYDNGRKKKGKKNDSVYGDGPKTKRVKLTLNKKEIKENRKIAEAPFEIPKELLKNRRKCNHADGTMTVQEFMDSGKNPAITPLLGMMVDVFGEDKVKVCAACYDVMLVDDAIKPDDVIKSAMTLYAASNYVVSHKKMSDEDVKGLAKDREVVEDFKNVVTLMRKIANRKKATEANPENMPVSKLNGFD